MTAYQVRNKFGYPASIAEQNDLAVFPTIKNAKNWIKCLTEDYNGKFEDYKIFKITLTVSGE